MKSTITGQYLFYLLFLKYKILERLIHDQLYEYVTKNILLSECQSGFRRFHSTTTSLLDATNEWSANMGQGKLNSVVLLDLSKAKAYMHVLRLSPLIN